MADDRVQPEEGLLSDKRRKYYSAREVAEHLGLSRGAVYKFIARGEIRAKKFGRSVRIPRDEILRYERESGYLESWSPNHPAGGAP